MAERFRSLVSEAEIAKRVRELAVEIRATYDGEEFTVLGLLEDSFVFLADLVRQINSPLLCSFIHASLHESGGHTDIIYTSETEVTNRNVLVVSGILDTGVTFDYVLRQLQGRGAKTLRACVLVDKPDSRKIEVAADFVGFRRSEEMIFGYGLGLRDNYRYLSYLAILEPAAETEE